MLLLLLTLLGAPVRAEVVDRVVTVVEDDIVLASEVELEAVLAILDPSPIPFWEERERDPHARLVDAAVVRHLAGDLAIYQPTPQEVHARVEAIRAHFPDRAAWTLFLAAWSIDESALRLLMRRRMLVERYLTRTLSEDPADRSTWIAACDHFLGEARRSLRIREVAPIAPGSR